jgi:hypothetical protein
VGRIGEPPKQEAKNKLFYNEPWRCIRRVADGKKAQAAPFKANPMLAIARLALRRPYTFVVMAILIAIYGTLATIRTPVDIFPNIGIRSLA